MEPAPFRPVMRGLLLTGGAPLYLRSVLTLVGEPESGSARRSARRSVVSRHALWWPPGKIAGRYLAPLLSTSQLQDFSTTGETDDRDDARELALLLADEEAAMKFPRWFGASPFDSLDRQTARGGHSTWMSTTCEGWWT